MIYTTPARHAPPRFVLSLVVLSLCALWACGCGGKEEEGVKMTPIDRIVDMARDAGMTTPDMSGVSRDMMASDPGGVDAGDQATGVEDSGLEDMSELEEMDMTPENPRCALRVDALIATGQSRRIQPGDGALASALAMASAGDRIVLEEGTYRSEALEEIVFDSHVFIEAAPGATVTMRGLSCVKCQHLVFRGMSFVSDPDDDAQRHVVDLDASSDIVFDGVNMSSEPGRSTLRIYGQRSGASSRIDVFDSVISGGQRTVFIAGKFAPSEQWNHGLRFVRNQFECGTSTCMQISGGRDVLIADNTFQSIKGVGLLTAGATRVDVLRNVFLGSEEAGTGMNLATPGKQWDNFNGVDHMISSDLHVLNNLLVGWSSTGIQLNAVTQVDIAHNTIVGDVGVRTSHRQPQKWMSEEVILEGNQDYRIWHNILDRLVIDRSDPRPIFEVGNAIRRDGAGNGVIEADPQLDATEGYSPSPGSPVIDPGTVGPADAPIDHDRWGQPRDATPDVGALEFGSVPFDCLAR